MTKRQAPNSAFALPGAVRRATESYRRWKLEDAKAQFSEIVGGREAKDRNG